MAVINVAVGQSIQAAINGANSGDTIDVAAGTYNDQFLTIQKSLTLQAVGGQVVMTEDVSPPNGKAMITEGASGISVAINGFDISGVSVADHNGAAIRYEGGNLSLADDFFHNNQEGLLGAADAGGNIAINHSEFAANGDGSGSTHNIYIGAIASFTLTNSYIHDAVVGHEVKTRAATNTITNNRIFDNNGSASYSVDVPNGGNASITGNTIEQGAATQNPAIFAWGEEGITHPGMMFITGNTIVNDDLASNAYGVLASSPASFTNNDDWNLANLGNVVASNNTNLGARPVLDTSSLTFGTTVPPPVPVPPPMHGHGHGHGHHANVVSTVLWSDHQ